MGNDKGGAPLHDAVHAALHHLLGAGVDARGGLIENECGGIGHGCPGNGQQLALTLREVAAVAGEHGLIAVGKAADEVVGIDQLCGLDAFFVGGVEPSVAYVFHNGPGEEVCLLQHNAERAAEVGLADAAYGQLVVVDHSVLDVVESVNEVDDGGLSCTRSSHDGNLLTSLGVERDVEKHLFGWLLAVEGWRVGKVHAEEVYLALLTGIVALAVFPSPDVGLLLRLGDDAIL